MYFNTIKKIGWVFVGFFALTTIQSCSEDPDGSPATLSLPVLEVSDLELKESDTDEIVSLALNLVGSNPTNAVVSFAAVSNSATAGADFEVLTSGKIIFSAEEKTKAISIKLFGDEVKELKETFTIKFYNPINMSIKTDLINVTILDDDDNTAGLVIPTTGYSTPTEYDGYNLVWADEFNDGVLNDSNWSHETGGGGWGNNEWQYYREDNVSFLNGNLVITAKDQKYGGNDYTSSRIVTKGKKAFKYGRVDIRAALPKGKGLWPALWMLGTNISSVGWPACGEIDIMELTGDLPNRVLSTVHFGPSVAQRQFKSNSKYLTGNEDFNKEFHVFSMDWKENIIEFYVDDEKFYTITPADTGTAPYPFNKNFFFIFNVAVGGDLPGYPDATTAFPQSMIVDYVRVFQPK